MLNNLLQNRYNYYQYYFIKNEKFIYKKKKSKFCKMDIIKYINSYKENNFKNEIVNEYKYFKLNIEKEQLFYNNIKDKLLKKKLNLEKYKNKLLELLDKFTFFDYYNNSHLNKNYNNDKILILNKYDYIIINIKNLINDNKNNIDLFLKKYELDKISNKNDLDKKKKLLLTNKNHIEKKIKINEYQKFSDNLLKNINKLEIDNYKITLINIDKELIFIEKDYKITIEKKEKNKINEIEKYEDIIIALEKRVINKTEIKHKLLINLENNYLLNKKKLIKHYFIKNLIDKQLNKNKNNIFDLGINLEKLSLKIDKLCKINLKFTNLILKDNEYNLLINDFMDIHYKEIINDYLYKNNNIKNNNIKNNNIKNNNIKNNKYINKLNNIIGILR